MKYPLLFLGFCGLLLTACVKPKEVGKEGELSKVYFDVEGLLDEQQKMLENQNPGVRKTTLIGEKEEVLRQKDVKWQKELKLFSKIDINKPVLLRSYTKDTLNAQNGKQLSYEAKNEDLKVRSLQVELNEDGSASRIDARIREENPVYLSARKMSMEFEEGKLMRYKIEGFQKVVIQDTTRYQMEVEILW